MADRNSDTDSENSGLDSLIERVGTNDDDYLDGSGVSHRLRGLDGNDTYVVDDVGDEVIERARQGNDTVMATISYRLSKHLENLKLLGSTAMIRFRKTPPSRCAHPIARTTTESSPGSVMS